MIGRTEPIAVYGVRTANDHEFLHVRLHALSPAERLTFRRIVLGLSLREVATETGLPRPVVRQAHSPGIRLYPYMKRAQEQIARAYTEMEVVRGYRAVD
jgi:FixJ family two-component response regulator